ncbi:alcohol dehydrogenase catalytic domain-containing protein [Cohnella sp. CFH 77786]|uniref:zinc-binding alcohol dehydrogenase family protein n=1 Tax=Cohnella sp. CFH 77786 TaxID=2662265 RepID=UPI001C610D0C|nr:zinc-binding alcohol dehydrogenase family protein [Cohnella sp. CFH 77786]MBW5449081.1 alcohol dehydrogenase catalytic domain-containing protein [Cohnella sp. CFH 77786]
MKGIVCETVESFRYRADLPEPEMGPGEAIVGIRRIGICGTDLHAYKGNQPFFEYPRILGHELAGVIERISPNAAGLQAGDQVGIVPYLHCGSCIACRNGKTNCCTSMKVLGVHVDGGMRERIAVPVTHLIRTEGLSLDEAAMLEPLAIGAHAVRRSDIRPGETALVIGGGPIGLGVMAFAKHRGAKVIAMDLNEERLEFCRSWAGADLKVNAAEDPMGTLLAGNGSELPSVVFDATGSARSMAQAFDYVSHGGKLVYVGLVKADITFHDPDFHKKEMTLMGSRNAVREDFENVMALVRAGGVDINRYITHRATLDQMIGRFADWLMPESKVIKAMVELA